jgi:hypothetical protein
MPQKNELDSVLHMLHTPTPPVPVLLLLLLQDMHAQCCFAGVLSSITAIFYHRWIWHRTPWSYAPPCRFRLHFIRDRPFGVHGFLSQSAKSVRSYMNRCGRYSTRWMQLPGIYRCISFYHCCGLCSQLTLGGPSRTGSKKNSFGFRPVFYNTSATHHSPAGCLVGTWCSRSSYVHV